jgi:universal stress protein A
MITISRILHPTDFSASSAEALDYATTLAQQFNAELHLLHVHTEPLLNVSPPIAGFLPPGYQDEVNKGLQAELAKLAQDVGVTVVRKLLEGNAVTEVIRYANDNRIDLIVIGTHGRTGLKHLLIGSVAENVVRNASCPVLTIRA